MGTAIVSTGLSLDRHEVLSRVVLAVAGAIWLALAVLLPLRAARDRAQFKADLRGPAALTAPIATAVLGTRLTGLGWTGAGILALVVAFGLFIVLIRPVWSALKTPTVGVSLLLAVSAEAIALLAATLSIPERARWLLVVAFAAFALGLALYVRVIAQFDLHQLAVARGDHWITGGAIGIAALVAARLTSGADALALLRQDHRALQDIALALWIVTMLWLVVLVFAEICWPRPGYDLRRWSTVFPLGMYAACSFAVGAVVDVGAITSFARVWVWVGFGSWAVVFAATARRALSSTPARR